jgi:hypothetical protein
MATMAVMILVRLAMRMCLSPALEYRIRPDCTSINAAASALVDSGGGAAKLGAHTKSNITNASTIANNMRAFLIAFFLSVHRS